MKRVTIIIRPKIKLRKSMEFSAEEELVQQFKNITKTECPCCGKTMTLEKNVWRCQDCSYCISQQDMLHGYTFWFCDECERFLNVQPGFTEKTGKWRCISCGFLNDVSPQNLSE